MMGSRQHQFRLLFYFLLLICSFGPIAFGQDSSSNHRSDAYWFHAGIGASSLGLAEGLGISYRTGSNLLSLRLDFAQEINIFGPSPQLIEADIALLYGISTASSKVQLSASTGIGMVSGIRRGRYLGGTPFFITLSEYEKDSYRAVSLPIEVQTCFRLSSYIGIGLYGFAELNHEQSFAGGLLCLEFGVMR